MRTLDRRLPTIAAMERAAARRVPRFVFDFVRGGIGVEACLAANRRALDEVLLVPRYLPAEPVTPRLETTLFSRRYPLPFAPSSVGASGLLWPRGAERIAASARRAGAPVLLSSLATSSIEDIAAIAGDDLWFQLYCSREPEIENELIDRARALGCRVLMVTVDVPAPTRRARDIANGFSVPPRFGLSSVIDMALRPAWTAAMIRAGVPRFRSIERHLPRRLPPAEAFRFVWEAIGGHVTVDKLARIRERWPGRLILKGILGREDAALSKELGVDALVVSNHGGRQLDAAPTVPAVLPAIRDAVGPDMPLLADGGVRTGLDVARMIARGADFVLLGRAFVFALGAAGEAGLDHAFDVLTEELRHSMAQTGCGELVELRDRRAA